MMTARVVEMRVFWEVYAFSLQSCVSLLGFQFLPFHSLLGTLGKSCDLSAP